MKICGKIWRRIREKRIEQILSHELQTIPKPKKAKKVKVTFNDDEDYSGRVSKFKWDLKKNASISAGFFFGKKKPDSATIPGLGGVTGYDTLIRSHKFFYNELTCFVSRAF